MASKLYLKSINKNFSYLPISDIIFEVIYFISLFFSVIWTVLTSTKKIYLVGYLLCSSK